MEYKLLENIHLENTDDGSIIVDFNNGKFYEVNKCACIILEGISNDKNISEISNDICQTFNISNERAQSDTKKYIDMLISQNIIEHINF